MAKIIVKEIKNTDEEKERKSLKDILANIISDFGAEDLIWAYADSLSTDKLRELVEDISWVSTLE